MTIRCICIDDEPVARQGISIALAQFHDFELAAQYQAADEYLSDIKANSAPKVDVLFVDIEMPRMSGFELIECYPNELPLVVFVTAYDQYAVKAFEHQALDYVLKPINEERFKQVIDRIRKSVASPQPEKQVEKLLKKISILKQQVRVNDANISVKTDDGYFRIKVANILYIESVGDHVCIHLKDKQVITRSTLKHYAAELQEHGFYQIHKSSIINKKHVVNVKKLRFSDYEVELSNQVLLRLSRRYKSAINELLI